MSSYNYMTEEEAKTFTPEMFDIQIVLGLKTCQTVDDVLQLLKDVRKHEREVVIGVPI